MPEMGRVTLRVAADGDRALLLIDTVGVIVASAPGLLITPWHTGGRPVPGRFTLTLAAYGMALVPLAWCPHLARRWADQAGWIGVDWRAPRDDIQASGPARVFAWRLFDEWRSHCERCDRVEVVDRRREERVGRFRQVRRVGPARLP